MSGWPATSTGSSFERLPWGGGTPRDVRSRPRAGTRETRWGVAVALRMGLTIASQERTVTAGCTVTDGARRMHTMGDAAVFQPSVRLEWCASQPEASEDAERT